mgnify:CR=1 FL=1
MCKACDYTIHGAQHHFGWDNSLPPALRVAPGSTIEFHCHDSSAGQLGPSSTLQSVIDLDFGKINPCYPDAHGDDTSTINYTGSGRRGDQKLDVRNRALIAAAKTQAAVPLFNKLAVNRWQFLGFWTVSEPRYEFNEEQNRMLWKFSLTRR